MSGGAADDSRREDSPLQPGAPSALPRHGTPLAPDHTIPRRCPACYQRLDGLAAEGACPECGAQFTPASSQAYARSAGFAKSVILWWWPLLFAIVPVLLSRQAERGDPWATTFVAIAFTTLAIMSLGNSMFQGYRWARRTRLRNPSVLTYSPGAGVVLGSLGCGGLVFATSVVIALAGSCAVILSK